MAGDGRAGAYRPALADRHRRDQLRIRADEHVVLNDRAVLVCAVVIAGDRARADIDAAAPGAVADVAEMIGLAVCRDLAVLDLDEIADMHPVMQSRTWAQSRIRTDAAVNSRFAAVDVAERF